MKQKTSQGKYYVRARKERNLPRVTYPLQCAMRPRVGICQLVARCPKLAILDVLIFMYLLVNLSF